MNGNSAPVNARLVRAGRGARQPLHRHEDARAIIILQGAIIEDAFGDAARYAPADVFVRPAYFPHANEAGISGAAYVQVRLPFAVARRLSCDHGWRPLRGTWEGWRGCSTSDLSDSDAVLAALEGTKLSLLDGERAPTLSADAAFEAVARSAAPLGEIAAHWGLRPYEFTRRFTARHGMAPRAFRLRAYLHRAMDMIARDAANLAAIAAECGFSDQSHLTKAMRREIGLTPGEFRRLVAH